MVKLLLLSFLLGGCVSQQLVSTTYRGQVGRSVSDLFTQGVTTWQAGVEFKFDTRRH
jgi:hypothetical protein